MTLGALPRARVTAVDGASDGDGDGRRARRQVAAVLALAAWWAFLGPAVSLVLAGRLPADRLSTGRIAETAAGSLVATTGFIACVLGCLGIVVVNLLRDPTRVRPVWPLACIALLFGAVSVSHLIASGGEIRSGSRMALLLALTLWSIQPSLRDLRVIGVAGLIVVGVSVALLPSEKTWMPKTDVVLQEKAFIGSQLMAGPFGQSNVLGLVLAVALPFVFLFRRKFTRVASFLVIAFTLVLTGSRSSLIGVGAALAIAGVAAVLRDRFLSGAAVVLGALGLAVASLWLPLTTNDPQAFTQRGSIWMVSRRTWGRDDVTALFGNGLDYYGLGGRFAVFDHGSPTYHGHNEAVSLMTTSGAVSLIAFCVVLATALHRTLRSRRPGRLAGATAVLVLLGCGIAETPLRFDTVDSLGWISWAGLLGLVMLAPDAPANRDAVAAPQAAPPARMRSRS